MFNKKSLFFVILLALVAFGLWFLFGPRKDQSGLLPTRIVQPTATVLITPTSSVGDQPLTPTDEAPPTPVQPDPIPSPTIPIVTPAPTSAPAPTSTPESVVPTPSIDLYLVKSGDYLTKIAKENYGDSARWLLIYDATNRAAKLAPESFRYIDDPDFIYPDDLLVLPIE